MSSRFFVDLRAHPSHDRAVRSIPFIKCHGLGNDFILIDALDHHALDDLAWDALAPRLCDRRLGIGADGVLILSRTHAAHAAMRIFNADGSSAQMCGNGIRCVARHLAENRGYSERHARILTGRGVLDVAWRGAGDAYVASVSMGTPELSPGLIPVGVQGERAVEIDAPISASIRRPGGVEPTMTCVSMGNPHAVLFCADAAGVDLANLAGVLRSHPIFPQSVNVHVVQVVEPRLAIMRSFERGAGETPACGTGACAALVAGVLAKRLERAARLRLPGGELEITWEDSGVTMTGPATLTYSGTLSLDA